MPRKATRTAAAETAESRPPRIEDIRASLARLADEAENRKIDLESDFPDAVAEAGDQRLPATYANFLVINGAVLYPTYGQPENDKRAAQVLQEAFPGREIVGIDCRVLIRQHGSLHCVTMQYPR